MSDKFEKLLDLLVNEQKDDAEKLFHDIVVEKSREIYEGILAEDEKEEEVSETEQSSDKAEGDEVEEAKDESKDSEEKVDEDSEEEVDEETVEEIGGDQTDDLLSDIESEAHGMDPEMGNDDEAGEEEEESDDVEAKFDPLEKELEALKAEFASMMDDKGEEEETEEESFEPAEEPAESTEETLEASEEAEEVEEAEKKDADTLIKEYSEQMKADLADHADGKTSPVATAKKSTPEASAVDMSKGDGEKGGVGKALTGDTAKDMGISAKNEPGIKHAKLDNAPKAKTSE